MIRASRSAAGGPLGAEKGTEPPEKGTELPEKTAKQVQRSDMNLSVLPGGLFTSGTPSLVYPRWYALVSGGTCV